MGEKETEPELLKDYVKNQNSILQAPRGVG